MVEFNLFDFFTLEETHLQLLSRFFEADRRMQPGFGSKSISCQFRKKREVVNFVSKNAKIVMPKIQLKMQSNTQKPATDCGSIQFCADVYN